MSGTRFLILLSVFSAGLHTARTSDSGWPHTNRRWAAREARRLLQLPFLQLGTTPGVSQVFLPANDEPSSAISISGGFPMGPAIGTKVYVGADGLLSFGRPITDFTPTLFPGEHTYIVAPFWANTNIATGVGQISYEVHNSANSTVIAQIDGFIDDADFVGQWMLVAEWKDVPQYGGSTLVTNTFQGILITDGSRSYTVFIYRCGQMGWSGGATIGFNADDVLFQNHPLSGSSNVNSIACLNSPASVWSNVVYPLTDVLPPLPVCEDGILDIYFVLDASASISFGSVNFQDVLEFVEDVVQQFHIGLNATQVGVIRFETSAQIIFPLNMYDNVDSLSNAIQDIVYTNGNSTNTAVALNLLVDQAFSAANGARPLGSGVLRVAIIIVDGTVHVPPETQQAAQRVCHNRSITSFGIGVRSGISDEVQSVACNQSQYVFELTYLKSRLVQTLSDRLCHDNNECLGSDLGSGSGSGSGPCDQMCINTLGSFYCQCRPGYALASNGRTCNQAPCLLDPCDSNAECIDHFNGSFECFCYLGFTGNGSFCADINECKTESASGSISISGSGSGVGGPCDQICTNIPGSFMCQCMGGYSLEMDGHSCREVCSGRNLDLYFVLDASGSVGSANFQEVLEYVADTIQIFVIGLNATRVGVMRFDDSSQIIIHLNMYSDVYSLTSAIQSISYTGGGTDTAEALNLLVDQGLTEANGARPWEQGIPRVAVVITDGRSSDETATQQAAQRVCQSYITTFAVGVGSDINIDELHSIACDRPQNVFEIAGYVSGDLQILEEDLGDRLCYDPCIVNPCGSGGSCISFSNGNYTCTCEQGYAWNGSSCSDINECIPESGSGASGSGGPCDHICINTHGSFLCQCNPGYFLRIDGHTCREACARALDLYFILDASGSVGSADFQEVLEYVADTVQTFVIGLNETRVGVMRFDDSSQIIIHLNMYSDVYSLTSAIQSISYTGGGTDTAEALNLLVDQGLTEANGARPWEQGIPRVAVVITDGRSSDETATRQAAQRVCQSYITTFAVGVGSDINIDELHSIACDRPQNVFEIAGFVSGDLLILEEDLGDRLCYDPFIVNPCGSGGSCISFSNGNYTCTCEPGYARNGSCCSDINECIPESGSGAGSGASGSGGPCDHICINTHGSFLCQCNPGYFLRIDGHTCEEVLVQLPFLQLGTTPGVSQVFLPANDDEASSAISISGGFPFGPVMQTTVYVGTNGLLSFGRPITDFTPTLFPGEHTYIVAPFWANTNIATGVGQISYEVHHESVLVPSLSSFISEQQNTVFHGQWMLVAEWRNVPQYRGSGSVTNTFQGILITDGSQSYTVFIYRCGLMEWSGGATIGFNADGSFYQNHPLSGSNANSIACVNSPATVWSNVIYRLSLESNVSSSGSGTPDNTGSGPSTTTSQPNPTVTTSITTAVASVFISAGPSTTTSQPKPAVTTSTVTGAGPSTQPKPTVTITTSKVTGAGTAEIPTLATSTSSTAETPEVDVPQGRVSGGLSWGAIGGIVFAVIVCVILLATVAILLYWKKRRRWYQRVDLFDDTTRNVNLSLDSVSLLDQQDQTTADGEPSNETLGKQLDEGKVAATNDNEPLIDVTLEKECTEL